MLLPSKHTKISEMQHWNFNLECVDLSLECVELILECVELILLNLEVGEILLS